ncbi:hypothetical protein Q6A26_04085 [Xanthomonas euvesicatoria pv. eucalypti]|uniref:type IVB secretion system protein IcmW n=1 Tax=Lysobacteraceae TaxID=32033 RepID=UPI00080ECEBF|nr:MULTISPECIES: hypothetical protein [Xanthomonadaceae]MCC8799133.1 hypothetical protein [Xanthomonas euvesicatoria pv. euvesicatoria]MCC8807738.1 hypothetical protein [Xanthomonas euvesicatoria pv. euvesicatoria]MCC8816183.1 hypothetical protein [Xanthomonas euvesicatoria pv. euvesicatoria]MDO7931586.1 hypothetical protein [Xanthomonas euvesicatoria pv. eucalypti]MDO7935687.1 hypothetical protein [Xanthomonas euvesicatoria pv. eucalypti]
MAALDLAPQELVEFWRSYDPELGELVSVMDRAESWTVDRDPTVTERLISLGRRMNGPEQARAFVSADVQDLLLFLAYISTSRALRVIHWLDEQDEYQQYGSSLVERLLDAPGHLAEAIPTPPLRDLLAHRLRVISNTPYFTKLFAPERLSGLGAAITRYRQEAADVS